MGAAALASVREYMKRQSLAFKKGRAHHAAPEALEQRLESLGLPATADLKRVAAKLYPRGTSHHAVLVHHKWGVSAVHFAKGVFEDPHFFSISGSKHWLSDEPLKE